jgi:hypothetical protein
MLAAVLLIIAGRIRSVWKMACGGMLKLLPKLFRKKAQSSRRVSQFAGADSGVPQQDSSGSRPGGAVRLRSAVPVRSI